MTQMTDAVCVCGASEGFTFDANCDLWVCASCSKPTRGLLDSMYRKTVPVEET